MTTPLLGNAIDERFLMHRLKSTSIAGVAAGVLAMALFAESPTGWQVGGALLVIAAGAVVSLRRR